MAQTTRNFFCVSYLPEDIIKTALSDGSVMHYAYAKHDKDENEPHTHIVIRFNNNRSVAGVREFWKNFAIVDGVKIANTLVEPAISLDGAFAYLTHKNEVDKYHYPDDIIVSDDIGYFRGDFSRKPDKQNGDSPAFQILQDILAGTSWLEMARKWGREIIINRHAYLDFADLIRKEEARTSKLEANTLPVIAEVNGRAVTADGEIVDLSVDPFKTQGD